MASEDQGIEDRHQVDQEPRKKELRPKMEEKTRRASVFAEDDHEAAEVCGQRKDPDHGEGAHLHGDDVRHGEQESGRKPAEHRPEEETSPGDLPRLRGGPVRDFRDHRPQFRPKEEPGAEGQDQIERVAPCPEQALGLEPPDRFDQERVGQKSQQGAGIGGPVEGVGIRLDAQGLGPGQPQLGRDDRGRQDREGKGEVYGQKREKGWKRRVRSGFGGDPEGQVRERQGKQRQMPAADPAEQEVAVEISREQHDLEEE